MGEETNDVSRTQSELLEQRIAENSASQQVDLATWIFERVHVKPGERFSNCAAVQAVRP